MCGFLPCMEGKTSGILAHRAGNYGGLDEILEAVLGRVDGFAVHAFNQRVPIVRYACAA